MTRSRCSSIDKSVELIASILIVKKIEKSNSTDSADFTILIKFTYRSTSSRKKIDDHDLFVLIVEFFKNHVRLWRRRCWIDEKRHFRYRTDSRINETIKMK
jgi:hypothetical protein